MYRGPDATTIIISIAVMVLVFLILREVFCWYWKINARLAALKELSGILGELSNASRDNSRQLQQISAALNELSKKLPEMKPEKLGGTPEPSRPGGDSP